MKKIDKADLKLQKITCGKCSIHELDLFDYLHSFQKQIKKIILFV